jgi:hypothetical protein
MGVTKSVSWQPTLVNWSQYAQKFGGFVEGAFLPDSVYGYFANGGSICYIVSIKTLGSSSDPEMAATAQTTINAEGDKGGKVLEISAKEGGPAGNKIEVEIKPAAAEAPAEGEGEGKGKAITTNEFTVVVKVNGQPEETFTGLTTGKGDKNVASVLKTRSRLVTANVVGKADCARGWEYAPLAARSESASR